MQASSHVIPLWLITLASKELSRFEVTSSDLSAESGSMEGGGGVGWWYHFCQMVGRKMRIIKVLVLKTVSFSQRSTVVYKVMEHGLLWWSSG